MLNKKDIINFIRLTDPVGEYFEELGGIFINRYDNLYTSMKSETLLFVTQQEYWVNINKVNIVNTESNHLIKRIKFVNKHLNMNFTVRYTTISQLISFEFNMFKINNYRDYTLPKNFELEFIYEVFNNLPRNIYYDTDVLNIETVIPLVRRIVIE